MNINLSVKSIDDEKTWENFLTQHSPGALFQTWDWGEVQKRLGSEVKRVGYYRGQSLVGMAQALKVPARRGPFLHVRHGPILKNPSDREEWAEILQHLKQMARQQGCWFIRINPLIPDANENRLLAASLGLRPAPIHAMDGEYCWVLDLESSDSTLLAGMRKSTRYDIRRAEQMGLQIITTHAQKDLASFLALYEATTQRHGFVPHRGIREEVEQFKEQGKLLLLQAVYEDKVLAAAIILFVGDQAIYHHGASISSKIPATAALQWYAIREAKKRGLVRYNFWGIAPPDKPNHPWKGITLFKQGFGGHEIAYLHAYDLPLTPLYALPFLIESFRRIQKGY